MTIWTQPHLQVQLTNTLKYLANNPSYNSAQLFESIKSDLSKEEDFDNVIAKGEVFFGKKVVSNGNAIIKNNNNLEVEFEISFDYIGVNRADNSTIGDSLKGCIFKFKIDKGNGLITDYNYQQK